MAASNTDLFRKNAPLFSTTLNGSISASSTTIVLQSIANLPTDTGISLVIDAVNAQGQETPSLQETVVGVVSSGTVSIINALRGVEGTAQSHATGATVYGYVTAADWNANMTGILKQHTQSGAHTAITNTGGIATDTLTASGLITANGGLDVAGGTLTLPNGSITFADLLSTIFSGQVTSYTNTGTAGGTMYYINLGGIKLLWGQTGTINNTGSTDTSATFTITLPTSFFSMLQTVNATAAGTFANTQEMYANVFGYTTTTITLELVTSFGTNGSGTIFYFVIGT